MPTSRSPQIPLSLVFYRVENHEDSLNTFLIGNIPSFRCRTAKKFSFDPGVTLLFQQRNSDLERNLTSHKRNNEQLGNHVNEQVNKSI